MGFPRDIIAVAPLLLAAVKAADTLSIGNGPSSTGVHIGDAIPVTYAAPNNEVVTVALVSGPATNLVVVSDLFTGTGSSFTFTPAATLTPGTYALGIYDASTYNFWPYFDLAAATTSASTSTPMTASSTSSSTTTQLQPQYVPSSYSSAAVSTPTMTSPPVTTSTMIATTPATMSTFPVSIGAPAPLYQNTTVTTTECSCTDSSTPTAVGGVPTIVSSMPWSSNSSYSATWSPSTTVPALSASVSPSASPASSASVSPSVSPYQPGNSGGSVNSASGLVSAFGVIALAIWCF